MPKIVNKIILGSLIVFGLAAFLTMGVVLLSKRQESEGRGPAESKTELTLEQKVGQLFIIGFEGTVLDPQAREMMRTLKPGGVLLLKKNIENPSQLKKLIADLQSTAGEYSGLPLFIGIDQEGGAINRADFLSEKTGQAKIETAEQAYDVGLKRGQGLKDLGVNLNLAPLLDAAKKGDFIFERTFPKTATPTIQISRGLIKGQKQAGVLTCVKHFPGYGGIAFNPEEKLATLSQTRDVSLFKEVMVEQPEMAMTANVVFQDIDPLLPFTFSSKGIGFLRETLGEDVLVMSDDLSQDSLLSRFSLEQIIGLPVEAGVDIIIFSGWKSPVPPAVFTLQQLVRDGQVSGEKIDRAVARITKVKEKMVK